MRNETWCGEQLLEKLPRMRWWCAAWPKANFCPIKGSPEILFLYTAPIWQGIQDRNNPYISSRFLLTWLWQSHLYMVADALLWLSCITGKFSACLPLGGKLSSHQFVSISESFFFAFYGVLWVSLNVNQLCRERACSFMSDWHFETYTLGLKNIRVPKIYFFVWFGLQKHLHTALLQDW